MTMTPQVVALYRYPVKGLSSELLSQAALMPGGTMPADRKWAIEAIPGKFDDSAPAHQPKIVFYMLMRDERLAQLRTRYDDATTALTIADRDGLELTRGLLATEAGRREVAAFVASFLGPDLRGVPRVVSADGHSFSDVKEKCLHIINLASLRELERIAGRAIDPVRFRANVLLDGMPAWSEFDLLGREVRIGEVTLKVYKRTQRCAATNVDPKTAQRDMAIPELLATSFGHSDFGVYATVENSGAVHVGDRVAL